MIKTLAPIILASGSSIRKRLLHEAGVAFTVIPPMVDEDAFKDRFVHLPFSEQALQLALIKGESVSRVHPESYVIAADQVCALDSERQTFGKPLTLARAKLHLQSLRGKSHSQNSGVCLLHQGVPIWTHTQRALIQMRQLTDREIDIYLAKDKPLQACGAYQLEDNARHLFASVQGSDDNILGLPLVALLSELYHRGLIEMTAG